MHYYLSELGYTVVKEENEFYIELTRIAMNES